MAMSSETKNAVRSLNPWVFNLQKLGLELKCPLCMNLLTKPMLLPCNHIFCKLCVPKSCQFGGDCDVCQHHFTDQEIRPASYMENIVSIYKSLKATFNSTILPLLSTDSRAQISIHEKPSEAAPEEKNKHIYTSLVSCVEVDMELDKKSVKDEVLDELDMNQAPEMSPESSLSIDSKNAGSNSDPGSTTGNTENNPVKRSTVHHGEMNHKTSHKDTTDAREPKRQKRLCYGPPEAVILGHRQSPRIIRQSDCVAVLNSDGEHKYKGDTSVIYSSAVCEASDMNGSICAFCHSSKINEETGLMLHYANGKAIARDEVAYSNAVSVHSKCIDWAPKVYYVGETIKNLELELARASKLKCSECGLKGAALGCFVKSCRRSYHAPCAVRIPDCRWDCDEFLMLCPVHQSIKFPSEKRKSRKPQRGETHPLSTQIASDHLNFWATSNHGPQEWVFCGSALSSEERSLLVKFAALSGATVVKSWNPNVTHVIAATDSNGACSRTLKVLMAILNGKWILTIDWVKACMKAYSPVNEEPYEIDLDNHGCHDGPRRGRLRASNNGPTLFDGIGFYFSGDFIPAYKSDLLDLVRVGGGTIFETMEQIFTQRSSPQVISTNLVVYNRDSQCTTSDAANPVLDRITEAKYVAKCIGGAPVIPHTWILESIAACSVLPH